MKTTKSPDKPALSRNNSSKSASNRNINSRPVFKKNDGDSKVNKFGVGGNSIKHAKKSEKLSKLGISKSKKISKSQSLAKSGKKLSKSGNSTNFDIIKNRSKFLTSNAITAF